MSRRLLFVTAVVLVAAIPCAADPAGTPATTPVFTVERVRDAGERTQAITS